jgi:hypothetical protein
MQLYEAASKESYMKSSCLLSRSYIAVLHGFWHCLLIQRRWCHLERREHTSLRLIKFVESSSQPSNSSGSMLLWGELCRTTRRSRSHVPDPIYILIFERDRETFST